MLSFSVFLRLEDARGDSPGGLALDLRQILESRPPGRAGRFRIRELAVGLEGDGAMRFKQVGRGVMLGSECVLTARSKTMAKRAANALNRHIPTKEGV